MASKQSAKNNRKTPAKKQTPGKPAAGKKTPAVPAKAAPAKSKPAPAGRKPAPPAPVKAVREERPAPPVPAKSPMNAQERKEMRERLLRLRDRITGQINFLATDNLNRKQDDAEVDFRSEEQGTDNFDRDFALNRVSLDQDTIFEIDEAINKIQIGAYGLCENCAKAIEKARLKALPYSRMCVACQSKAEAGRKRFRPFDSSATLFPTGDKAAAEAAAEDE